MMLSTYWLVFCWGKLLLINQWGNYTQMKGNPRQMFPEKCLVNVYSYGCQKCLWGVGLWKARLVRIFTMFSSLALPRSILSSGFLVNDYADLLVSIQFPIAPLLLSTCSSGPHPLGTGDHLRPASGQRQRWRVPRARRSSWNVVARSVGSMVFTIRYQTWEIQRQGNSASKTGKETSIKDNYTNKQW